MSRALFADLHDTTEDAHTVKMTKKKITLFFYISIKLISILKLRCLKKNKHILSLFSSLRIFLIDSISSQINCKEYYHTNKQNAKKH